MKIKWYGHSAFRLMTADSVSIIIDTYQTGGLFEVISSHIMIYGGNHYISWKVGISTK